MEFVLPVSEAETVGDGGFWGVRQRLQDFIQSQLAELVGQLPSKDVVLAAAKAAYERYVIPIDLPGVGPLLEPTVDKVLEDLFLRAVAAMYDRLTA